MTSLSTSLARFRRSLVVLVTIALAATGAILLTPALTGPDRVRLTAYFTGAVGLYPGSRVMVLGIPVGEVTEVYFHLADRLPLARTLDRIIALPRTDRWTSMARAALRDDLYATHAALTFDVLASGGPEASCEERLEAWLASNRDVVDRASQTLTDIEASGTWDLATLSVALRTTRTLLRQNAM